MILYVFAYHSRCQFIAYCSGEISIFPEFSSPQPILHFRVFSKSRSRTQALEPRHYLRDGKARWKRTEYMNMVCADFHLFYCYIVAFSYLLKQFSYSGLNIASQNVLAIFWRPYEVILRIVNSVRGSSYNHAAIINDASYPGSGHRARRQDAFSSPPQAAGYPKRFS